MRQLYSVRKTLLEKPFGAVVFRGEAVGYRLSVLKLAPSRVANAWRALRDVKNA